MKQLASAFLIFFLQPCRCLAQDAKKIPVAVSPGGDDPVGQAFVLALKEAIRGSKSLLLVDTEILPKTPRIVVHVLSVNNVVAEKGDSSAIGIIIVYDGSQTPGNGIYLSASVSICGKDRVESCAKSTLPDISVEFLRKDEPSLWYYDDRSDVVIPYRSVTEFYVKEAAYQKDSERRGG
jgi:hypothetical protein